MTAKEAWDILGKYGDVLEAKGTLAQPWVSENILPFPKNTIIEAFKIIAYAERNNTSLIDNLKSASLYLADFLPEEKANTMISWFNKTNIFKTKLENSEECTALLQSLKNDYEDVPEILKQIESESERIRLDIFGE